MKAVTIYSGAVGVATVVAFVVGTMAGDRRRDDAPPVSHAAPEPAPVIALPKPRRATPPQELESQWVAVGAALGEIAEKDPAAAFAELESLTMPIGVRASMRGKIFAGWAATDPDSAAVAAFAIDDALQRQGALEGVASGWAESDPETALEWAAGLQHDKAIRIVAMGAALLSAAEQDASSAAELALTLSVADLTKLSDKPSQGWPALVAVFRKAGDGNALVGFDLLEKVPITALAAMIESHVPSVYASAFSEMSKVAPELALRLAERFPSGSLAHSIVLCDALRGLAETDPERALALASALPLTAQKFAMERALDHLGKRDPQAAAIFAIQQTQFEPHIAYGIIDRQLSRLAKRDAAGAVQALELLSQTGSYSSSLRAGIVIRMAHHDPIAAIAQLGETEQDRRARFGIAKIWARADAAQFREWLNTADTDMRHLGRVALAESERKNDLEAAAAILAGEVNYAFDDTVAWQVADVIEDVAEAMADKDFDRAVSWLASLGDSPLTKRAATKLAELSLSFDSVGASDWIAQLPPGLSRDSAAKELVDSLRVSDPQAAYRWAIAIDDPDLRKQTLGHTVATYFQVDAPGAVAAISELASGEIRDASIGAICEQFSNVDAPAAFALARLTSNNEKRISRMIGALHGAGGIPARRELAESLPTTDPARARLLELIEKWELPPSGEFRFGYGYGF